MSWIEPLDNNSNEAWTPNSTGHEDSSIDEFDYDSSFPNLGEDRPDKVFFASSSSDSTYEHVKDNLEASDIDVEHLSPEDIERDGEDFLLNGENISDLDAKVYLRPKRWTDVGDDWSDIQQMIELNNESSIEFYGDPQVAVLAEDKKATKDVFESVGVGTVDDFSYEDALEKIKEGDELVVKPRFNSSLGNGIESVETEEEIINYREDILEGDYLVEEKIDHGADSENSDMRMVITGEESFRAERTGGDGVASNLCNGGEYQDPDEMSFQEEILRYTASEILGDGFYSIDYIKEDDGSVNVMEINSTSGTKINDQIEDNLYNSISNGIIGDNNPPRRSETVV